MKHTRTPARTPPAINPSAVNGTHAFQRLTHDRQRDEIAKGIADFEQRLVDAGLIQKLGKPA